MLLILFVLLCIGASSIISILLRDHFAVKAVHDYLTIINTYGDGSINDEEFRDKSSLQDLLEIVRIARAAMYVRGREDERAAAAEQQKNLVGVLTKVVKNKRTPKRGKQK